MISAAVLLIMASAETEGAPVFRDAPAFAFACRPKGPASGAPTYEYRVFLPVKHFSSQIPVRVELTKMEGMSKDISSLRMERGNLWVFRGPGSGDDSPPMFKVDAFSGSATNVLYDFQMIFSRSTSTDQNGVSQVSISPSEGRLRITDADDEKTFQAECDHIAGGRT